MAFDTTGFILYPFYFPLWFSKIKPSAQSNNEFYGQWLSSKSRIVLRNWSTLTFFFDGIHQHDFFVCFFTKMNCKKNTDMLNLQETQEYGTHIACMLK